MNWFKYTAIFWVVSFSISLIALHLNGGTFEEKNFTCIALMISWVLVRIEFKK